MEKIQNYLIKVGLNYVCSGVESSLKNSNQDEQEHSSGLNVYMASRSENLRSNFSLLQLLRETNEKTVIISAQASRMGQLKSDRKWMLLLNNCYKIISGHFFAICNFIFHKTEVQTVNLRCLTGLNHNWFKRLWPQM